MTLSAMLDRVYAALSPRVTRSVSGATAFVATRPRLTLCTIAAITVVAALGVIRPDGSLRLEVYNNYEGDLNEGDPLVQTIRWFEELFGKNDTIKVVVTNPDGVLNDSTMTTVHAIGEALATLTDAEPNSVRSLTHGRSIIEREDDIAVRPIVHEIPPKEGWETVDHDCSANPLVEGRLITKNRKSCVVEARMRRSSGSQARITREVRERLAAIPCKEKLEATGQPLINEDTDRGIQTTIIPRYVLALICILGYFVWSYRTWRAAALPGIVILVGTVWTMGMIGWLGYTVNVMTSAIPVMIVIIGSSYTVQVVHRFGATALGETDRRVIIAKTVESVAPGLLIAGITSALGTAGLVVFRVTSIQQFGVFMTAGIVMELVIVFTLLPALLALLPLPKRKKASLRTVHRLTKPLLFLGEWVVEKRWSIVERVALLLIIAVIGITHLRVDLNFLNLLPRSEPSVVAAERCNKEFGGTMAIELAVVGDIKDPRVLTAIDALQRAMEREEGVGKTASFADIIVLLHGAFASDGSRLPDSREAVAQLLEVYQMGGTPEDFASFVDPSYTHARVIIGLTTSSSFEHTRIYKRLQERAEELLPPGVEVAYGGSALLYVAATNYIVTGKIWNSVSTVAIMYLFALIVFRSWLIAFLVVLPPTIASIIIFGTMGWIGIALYMGSATVTSLTLGIGIDPAVHYGHAFAKEKRDGIPVEARVGKAMVETGSAILNDSVSNILGFLVFLTSPFRVVQEFGFLMTYSMVLCLALTYLLIPSVYAIFRKKREGLTFAKPR